MGGEIFENSLLQNFYKVCQQINVENWSIFGKKNGTSFLLTFLTDPENLCFTFTLFDLYLNTVRMFFAIHDTVHNFRGSWCTYNGHYRFIYLIVIIIFYHVINASRLQTTATT